MAITQGEDATTARCLAPGCSFEAGTHRGASPEDVSRDGREHARRWPGHPVRVEVRSSLVHLRPAGDRTRLADP